MRARLVRNLCISQSLKITSSTSAWGVRIRHEDGRRGAADELGDRAGAGTGHHEVGGGKQAGDIVAEGRENRANGRVGLRAELEDFVPALAEAGDAVNLN